MNNEEKEAIEYFKKYINDVEKKIGKNLTTEFNEHLKVLLSQVEKQREEIEIWKETENDYEHELARKDEEIEKQQKENEALRVIHEKEIENEKLYTDFYKDLCDKQQKELENNKKFKKDIVNLIMLWDKEKLPENNMIIETLETIIHEFSRLENIEDEKIQVAVEFVEEKRDKYWKDKIRDKIKKLEKLYEKEMKPYQTEFGLNLSFLTKKEKEELINKRNSLLIEIETLKELLGEEDE